MEKSKLAQLVDDCWSLNVAMKRKIKGMIAQLDAEQCEKLEEILLAEKNNREKIISNHFEEKVKILTKWLDKIKNLVINSFSEFAKNYQKSVKRKELKKADDLLGEMD
ncbi:MAG: hypothetical protein WC285_02720 [Candidatus Gracilibacteria bacterium]|jgi:phosphopantetheine adenylyltransferase